MFRKDYYGYAENEDLGVQIAHLPYKSSDQNTIFVFTVVLPNQGVQLEQVEQKLTSNKQLRQQVLSNQGGKSAELLLYLPKFKLETKYELKDVLIKLGMEQAFSDKKADFEGIIGKVDDRNRVFISKVNIIHWFVSLSLF
jgi:serine protease inhibitor